jgi:NADPH-dependent F420 reductase
MDQTKSLHTIAILGGTGALGMGLASRWVRAGHQIIIGSRVVDKAKDAIDELSKLVKAHGTDATATNRISAADNEQAARTADICVLTVPFAHQSSTLQGLKHVLQGKIVVDVTVPLVPPAVDTVQLPAEGSAALRAQSILGKEVPLVSALQNVAAKHLHGDGEIDCDVLVSSDHAEAAELIISLLAGAGMRAFYVGALKNAVAAEALTSVLIHLNKRYRTHSGIRITGISD